MFWLTETTLSERDVGQSQPLQQPPTQGRADTKTRQQRPSHSVSAFCICTLNKWEHLIWQKRREKRRGQSRAWRDGRSRSSLRTNTLNRFPQWSLSTPDLSGTRNATHKHSPWRTPLSVVLNSSSSSRQEFRLGLLSWHAVRKERHINGRGSIKKW